MVERSVIQYADDEFGTTDFPAWLDVLDARQADIGRPAVPRPAGEAPDAPPVTARVNYGRWLADCECGASVLLFRGPAGQWFWCPACAGSISGGKLRPVVWPANRDQIDLDMSTLPAELAQWEPGI
jgi:hypothetical protein